MSYRKITVDDKQYEYVIGKTHTKIKGLGLFPNTEIGDTHDRPAMLGGGKSTFVTPGMISDVIRGRKPRTIYDTKTPVHHCKHGVVTPFTVGDPFDSEIYNRYRPMIACGQCVEEASWDI